MKIKKVNKSRKSDNCSVIKPMLKRPIIKRRQNEIEEEKIKKKLAVLVLESFIFMLKCGHIFYKLKP